MNIRKIFTRSRADPPPKYSIIIHNLVPCKGDDKGVIITSYIKYWPQISMFYKRSYLGDLQTIF